MIKNVSVIYVKVKFKNTVLKYYIKFNFFLRELDLLLFFIYYYLLRKW